MRGRAKGRARGRGQQPQQPQQPQPQPQPQPQQLQSQPHSQSQQPQAQTPGVPTTSQQSQRAQFPAQQRSAWGQTQTSPQQLPQIQQLSITPKSTSRQAQAAKGDSPEESSDNGKGVTLRGRGGYRGGTRFNIDLVNTKPEWLKNKQGNEKGEQELTLLANYFKFSQPPNLTINQYRVDIEPDVESSRVRRYLISQIKQHFNDSFIFDGMYDLVSLVKLRNQTSEFIQTLKDGSRYKITIKFTAQIDWKDDIMIIFRIMRFYNTLMKKFLREYLKWVEIGRSFYNPNDANQIQEHNISMWNGMITALAVHDGGSMIVCNPSVKCVRSDTVLSIMRQLLETKRHNFQNECRREIIGSIVLTRYNNRTYRVADIDFSKNPDTYKFEHHGRQISLVDYYRQNYKLEIRDKNQPLLVGELTARQQSSLPNSPRPILIPELCLMTGLTDSMVSNFRLMRTLADSSRSDPTRRAQQMIEFVRQLNSHPNVQQDLGKWNCKLEPNLVQVPARVLRPEKIFVSDNAGAKIGIDYEQKTGNFGTEMRSRKFFRMDYPIDNWILMATPKTRQSIDSFVQTLQRVSGPMGISLSSPKVNMLRDDRESTFAHACREVPPGTDLVVCLVPDTNQSRYDAIKKVLCIENPISSQVVVEKTLRKNLMSVCTKIAIQMACKIGGEAWAVEIPLKNIMVIGYDTYHDKVAQKKSVGGFVSSLNGSLTKWFSRVNYHNAREEMSNNFQANVIEAIKRYYKFNGNFPQKIFIYRDGVGEGMYEHVLNVELEQIKSALKKLVQDPNMTPKLAFVIVSKRINTRFFAKSSRGNELVNPLPGTVVDNVVTKPNRFDFFLISQSVRQGTVSPTSYNIIYADFQFPPTYHQRLAYKLTHLYYNWQGTLSVPAPCQYAHKLAYLTGVHLHMETNNNLSEKLFYL